MKVSQAFRRNYSSLRPQNQASSSPLVFFFEECPSHIFRGQCFQARTDRAFLSIRHLIFPLTLYQELDIIPPDRSKGLEDSMKAFLKTGSKNGAGRAMGSHLDLQAAICQTIGRPAFSYSQEAPQAGPLVPYRLSALPLPRKPSRSASLSYPQSYPRRRRASLFFCLIALSGAGRLGAVTLTARGGHGANVFGGEMGGDI